MRNMGNRGFISLTVAVASLLLTGCFHGLHEEWPPVPNEGYLTVTPQWENGADGSTVINSLTVSTIGTGMSQTERYAGFNELSAHLNELPMGEYDLVATVNMSDVSGFELTGLPATKAVDIPDKIQVSITDSTKALTQAWFGVGHASIKKDDTCQVTMNIQRLLPVFKFKIDNMPVGAKVELSFRNLAKSIVLTESDTDGRYGVPGTDCFDEFKLDPITVDASGTINVECLVPPVGSGLTQSELTVSTTTAETSFVHSADIPVMSGGKTYELDMDFDTMSPEMSVDVSTISDWEEGWIISGNTDDPNE